MSIPLGPWPRQRKCILFCWRAWRDGASLWPFTIFKVKTLKKLLKHPFHLELVFCYTIPQSTSVSSAMIWRHLSISSRRSERDTTFWINDRKYGGYLFTESLFFFYCSVWVKMRWGCKSSSSSLPGFKWNTALSVKLSLLIWGKGTGRYVALFAYYFSSVTAEAL